MSEAAAERLPEQPRPLLLGRYRPLRPLGSGGSGSVWLARDERSGRQVTVKIVPREGKSESRARREAQAMAQLEHPRCLHAYACGRDRENVYIAYEHVPGRTFREALRAGALNDDDVIEAAAQVLEGLAHAHARGIVHRDVKPANVLLADEREISVRILDFGLARYAEAETLTAIGDVPGTLAYIAPERLHGDTATPAGDVWSVGVMLHEALAGRHPFWRASLAETADAITAGPRPLAAERPDLPQAVLAAVDRAVALDPARRPSAAKLARMLRRSRGTGGGATIALVQTVERRFAPPALAGIYAGAAAALIPFYPSHWVPLLAAAAAALTYFRPRTGVAVALAIPVLPLGNTSVALAVLYGAAAIAWFALNAREPERATFVVLGPLLGPLGALAILPLLLRNGRSTLARGLQAGTAVLLAALAAGLRHAPLPLTGDRPPLGLGLAGGDRPGAAVEALWGALAAHPALLLEAIAIGAAAALLPRAERRGLWGLAVFGALFLGASLLFAPAVAALPIVLGCWFTVGVLAART
ncbi:MAG: eukaryotic-like serine/threonine-protein kinase [Gaiellaceae bacterium]|nr:eukaryotic-like serine/threonine-protein kinase [Gaiellaceae bacterium]